MRLALATPPVATSVDDGLNQMHRCIVDAAKQQAKIICFPEAYIPGLRGLDFEVPGFDVQEQQRVIEKVTTLAKQYQILVICSMEWHTDAGRHIAAAAIDANGKLLGVQTKNQLDPSEEPLYVPGRTRQLFEIDGLKFGIAICHEGFRYPETVRWAATRGAHIVFHPHCTGSDKTGTKPTIWGDPKGAYYEKAIMCRALENTIYFASVNYGFVNQESASCVIDPTGKCLAYQPYGEAGVLVIDIDVSQATGKLAKRLAPERYQDQRTNLPVT